MQDRQNFDSVTRLTHANVLPLFDNFPDAVGTKYNLLMIKNIVESYPRKDLSSVQRILCFLYDIGGNGYCAMNITL